MLKVITSVMPGGEKVRATVRIDGKTRQRTVPFTASKSWDWMHGTAAGALLGALGTTEPNIVKHDKLSNHCHVFWIEV